MEPLAEYFDSELERVGMVDLDSYDLNPIWVNNRVVDVAVAKRLDICLRHS